MATPLVELEVSQLQPKMIRSQWMSASHGRPLPNRQDMMDEVSSFLLQLHPPTVLEYFLIKKCGDKIR